MRAYPPILLEQLVQEVLERNRTINCTDVYSVTNSAGFVPSTEYFNKEVFSKDISSYKVVRKGMFAYNPSRINVGSLAWLHEMETVVVSPLYIVFQIDDSKLCHQYLNLFMHSEIGNDQIRHLTTGSVRDSLKFSALKRISIPLPPIDTQRRIAAVLDKAQSLIAARREQIAVLDKLSKDLFIDMFGDMNTNPMKWEMKNLLAVASIDTHMTSDFEKYADCYHIGIENIEKNSGAIINPTKVKDSGLISGKYPFDSRHIIYSKIRPNLNKVALPDFVGLCSADSYPILPKNDVCDRIYLAFVMRSEFFLSYILDFSGRSNIPKVNKQQLSSFNLPTPPIELQREFAKKVTAINCQKSRLVESLTELETLYKSLTQRAFAGELFT